MSTEPEDREIIHRPSRGLTISEGPANSIFLRMTRDVVDLSRSQGGTQLPPLKKIGKFELAEPDYETVAMWSDELSLSPECILNYLENWREHAKSKFYHKIYEFGLRIEHGKFKSFVWDFDQLPITRSDWCDRLKLEMLGCLGHCTIPDGKLLLKVRTLKKLDVYGIRIQKIDLSYLTNLGHLRCGSNEICELDLSAVPMLTELECDNNPLRELDLTPVPKLTALDCWDTELTRLDLTAVPKLTRLKCGFNELTELDLSAVPGLKELDCYCNPLKELDLSAVPKLTELFCPDTQLTELDLSAVPVLTMLHCAENQLTDLDLSAVPMLTKLYCNRNRLKELDLSAVPMLTVLICSHNQLLELDLSAMACLKELDCSENHVNEVYINENTDTEEIVKDPETLIVRLAAGEA